VAARRFTFLNIISSVLLALALWLYVSLTRTYEGDIQVPVIAIPPSGQTILSNVPKFITVHVRTNGLSLVNMTYYNKPQACTLHVAKLTSLGPEQFAMTNAELLRVLSDVVPSRMLSTVPSELAFTTGTPEIKKVPLTVPYSINVRPGFVLATPPTPEIQMVTLRGMKSVVQNITQWSTQKIFIEDAHEASTVDVPVLDSLTNVLDVAPKTIKVKLDIQRLADQVILDVPVTLIGAAAQSDVVLRPARIDVTVRGGVENISTLTRDDIAVEIESIPPSGFAIPKIRLAKNARVVSSSPRLVHAVRTSRK
jgi:YbbR domain-containing protein